ncbi:6-methylsalicylic acid synthase [Stemphylium lycopersici]|nr:6-methylsalicylic acid synthase [Stemphylium lycopersici]
MDRASDSQLKPRRAGQAQCDPTIPDDIAIVGLSCRTAGGIDSLDKLWDFLLQKKHASGEIPPYRWGPWRQRSMLDGKILDSVTRKGYFLDDVEGFDAAFFGISPGEAEHMDPHQRLGLELAYEALEHAGIQPDRLAGSDTAVYIGADSDDYSRMVMEDLPAIEAWSGIGTAHHGISNRISYHLDLKGPSAAVDAACASSLVALHLARQAIVSGESTMAICGGVNVICAPGITHMLQKAGALTAEGVCRSFDAAANGYARGEGGAIIVLKRLSAAQEDNDDILAVLKSSASAQDGRTRGIMAPNGAAQADVARQALDRAGNIDPHTVDYIEAHATSTPLGDPTEIKALAEVYGAGRSPEDPCYLGSIKPNIGHLEAAAGAISVVKTVLSVQKGVIAPQALLETLNTSIDWDSSGLEILREARSWPGNGVRRAAVCSYGYGGSVCHAIIEQAPPKRMGRSGSRSRTWVTLTLSALQSERLPVYAASLAHWLSTHGATEDLTAVARTLAQRRTAYDHRLSVDVSSREDAIRSLSGYANGSQDARTISNRVINSAVQKGVVWVFSGHGAQWPNMGQRLLRNCIFRSKLSELDTTFHKEAGFSSVEALQQGELGASDKIQMLTYAVQMGLASLLQAEGLAPQAVMGHSVGEISAAVIAGCLTSEEGAVIIARRANLYARVQGSGAMALVTLPFEEAAMQLSGRDDIFAAIQSSPSTCVVSGTRVAVKEYAEQLNTQGLKTRDVQTDIAFHSPLLKKLVPALQDLLEPVLHPRHGCLPVYSTSDSDARTTTPRDVRYWTRNMIAPVRLTDAVEAAVEDGFGVFLEVSTHPIVSQSIGETLEARSLDEYASFGVMVRNACPDRTIAQAISQLHTLGARVDFGVQLGDGPWSTKLPNTPWFHVPYWKAPPIHARLSTQQHDAEEHTLLGNFVGIAGSDTSVWSTTVDDQTKPYPLIHRLGATEIVPAAVYCNTFHHVAGLRDISDLLLRVPIPITAEKRELQVVLQDGVARILSRVHASQERTDNGGRKNAWVEHCTAKVAPSDAITYQYRHSLAAIRDGMAIRFPDSFAEEHLSSMGVSSMAFPWAVLEHLANEKGMFVQVGIRTDADTLPWAPQSWAPLIDAATSISACIVSKDATLRLVSGIDEVLFLSKDVPPKKAYLFLKRRPEEEPPQVDVEILDGDGMQLCRLNGMQFSDIEAVTSASPYADSLLYRLAWVRPTLRDTPLPIKNLVLVSGDASHVRGYIRDLANESHKLFNLSSALALVDPIVKDVLLLSDTVIVYVPERVKMVEDVARGAHTAVWETANILSTLIRVGSNAKLFVLLNGVHKAQSLEQVSHHSLYGFSRVAASEHPDLWGGLIDHEGTASPVWALQNVQEQSVIRVRDDGPCVARMRPFLVNEKAADPHSSLLPQPQGTYIITGGLGDLGLEVLEFLVDRGARRIVVVSRRPLPPRKAWSAATGPMAVILTRIQRLEIKGATIHALPLDISSRSASVELLGALERLSLPRVLGVIHAAAVPGFGYIQNTPSESYASVMAPKIAGALALHEAFPPGTLDFFILFSSVSGIIGTPGQSGYAASNAFLDGLATHRRSQGCNSIAIQWTAWRALGLASNTAVVDLELQAVGMRDITAKQAFQAWERLSSFGTDHAIVTRLRLLDAKEPAANDLIGEVVPRLSALPNTSSSRTDQLSSPELKAHVAVKIRECLSTLFRIDPQTIDDKTALEDVGIHSIMRITLRQMLQKELHSPVPMEMIARQTTREMIKFANPEAERALWQSPRSEAITAVVVQTLREFGITPNQLGYFALDNASNNDTAVAAIVRDYGGFDPIHCRLRCGLHTINLIGQALLFGDDKDSYNNAAEELRTEELYMHEWRRHGQLGTLIAVINYIRTPQQHALFRACQRDANKALPADDQIPLSK